MAVDFPADRPIRPRLTLVLAALAVGTYGAFRLARFAPGLVERLFARGVGPAIVRTLSLVTGLVPFSVLEVVIWAYIAVAAVWVVRGALSGTRGRRRWTNALASFGATLVRHVSVLVVLFYVFWGFNYARAPLRVRLGWPAWTPPTVERLEALAARSVEAANRAYVALHGSEDAGVPTERPSDLRALDRSIEEGWRRAGEELGLPSHTGRTYGHVKELLLTPVVARFGAAGFYGVWTAEAHVVAGLPGMRLGHSMAHEKAHQRGVGSEDEASFLGFVAGALAPDPYARYAAAVYASRRLLAELGASDPERAGQLRRSRIPGVRRDLRDHSEFWAQFRGPARAVGRAANDAFLRGNRVVGGRASYALASRLLVTFAELRGDDPFFAGGP